jgi:hypothetical protein
VRPLALLAVAALLLAGCGTTEKQQAEDIGSIASEGALLAHDAGEGSTTDTYTRVHGRALRDLAKKIADAPKARRIRVIAASVASDLETLAAHPGDEQRAQRLERRLERAAKAADRVA